jgi:osmotically-inducible protein OsmY
MRKRVFVVCGLITVSGFGLNAQNATNGSSSVPSNSGRAQQVPGVNPVNISSPKPSPAPADNVLTSSDAFSSQSSGQRLFSEHDQAAGDADRALIARIRTQAAPLIGAGDTGWPVHFIANEGKVTLAGQVPTATDQQRLRALVQQTPGVVEVTDTLHVAATASPVPGVQTALISAPTNAAPGSNTVQSAEDKAYTAMDQELVNRLRRSVSDVVGVTPAASPVHFTAKQGVVTLTGYVLSGEQRQTVMDLVKRTAGVASVDDQLRVSSEVGAVAAQERLSTNSSGQVAPISRSNSPARVYPEQPAKDTSPHITPAPAPSPGTR